MKFKKTVAAIALAMALSLAACGNQSTDRGNAEADAKTTTRAETVKEETKKEGTAARGKLVEPPAEDFSYRYDEELEGMIITAYKGEATDIRIPAELDGCPVVKFGDGYVILEKVTEIELPDSITVIGGSAFEGCKYLKSITIPDSVTVIGTWAFSNCTSLESVTIPNYVFIGDGAFEYCTSLTSIIIPGSITGNDLHAEKVINGIGRDIFLGCESLKKVTMLDGIEVIGRMAFKGCTSLESVTIPDSVTEIDLSAFNGCTGLESITIPNSVTEIGWAAFRDCTGLKNVTIPDNVIIREYAFENCTSLRELALPDNVIVGTHNAFEGCDSSLTVTYKGNEYNYTSWDELFEATH